MRFLLLVALLFIPSLVYSLDYACGKGSTVIVSHAPSRVYQMVINGVSHDLSSGMMVSFPCYSSVSISSSDGAEGVSIIPFGETSQELTYRQIASFLVGAFASMAFVIAVRGDV
jgi:hypothetical protein